MNKARIAVLIVSGGLFVAGQALAQTVAPAPAPPGTKTPRVDQRERNQQRRIRQGVKSGELTRAEAARLEAEQARIRANEAAAKSDGTVTAAERRRLNRQQNRASKKVARDKHDKKDRPRAN